MGIPPSVNIIKTPLVYIAGIKEHPNKALVTDFLQRMIKGFRIGYKEYAKKLKTICKAPYYTQKWWMNISKKNYHHTG